MLLSQSTSNLGRDISTQLSMRTHNQTHFDPRKASGALASNQIDSKSGGLLLADEYQRLMMVKDPAERAKSSRFGANYVNVKQTAAL